MLSPQEMERVVVDRMRWWEDVMQQEHRASQLPLRSPRWRRARAIGMAWIGARLARWGEWLAQRADAASMPMMDEFAHKFE